MAKKKDAPVDFSYTGDPSGHGNSQYPTASQDYAATHANLMSQLRTIKSTMASAPPTWSGFEQLKGACVSLCDWLEALDRMDRIHYHFGVDPGDIG